MFWGNCVDGNVWNCRMGSKRVNVVVPVEGYWWVVVQSRLAYGG